MASSDLLWLDSTEYQGVQLPLSNDAARFFWALGMRDAAYGPTADCVDSFDEFTFEAGLYEPRGVERPVSPRYLRPH